MPEVREEIFQTAQVERDEEEEVLEDFEIQEQEFELTETSFQAAELVDPGMANFGDISAPVTTEAAGVGEIETNTAAIDVGELFGEDGMGMSDVGAGMGGTSFFGVQTTGQRFVYVVDNSNSMNNGKFETAVYELMNSVDQLTEDHLFYVIFYSDMAYPLFYPQSAPRWVRATEENKYKLRSWLATVHRCLQTRGESAMAMALKLDPDVIYLLGDGAFTDNTAERTLEIRQKFPYLPVQIHTMGFRMKDKDRQMFTQIAQAYGGTFNEVDIRPEMVQLAKNLNRPKNREPNGPWGKALGKKK